MSLFFDFFLQLSFAKNGSYVGMKKAVFNMVLQEFMLQKPLQNSNLCLQHSATCGTLT